MFLILRIVDTFVLQIRKSTIKVQTIKKMYSRAGLVPIKSRFRILLLHRIIRTAVRPVNTQIESS